MLTKNEGNLECLVWEGDDENSYGSRTIYSRELASALKTWWQIGFNEWIWVSQVADCIKHVLHTASHPPGFIFDSSYDCGEWLCARFSLPGTDSTLPQARFFFWPPGFPNVMALDGRKHPFNMHPTCAVWEGRRLTFPGNPQPMGNRQIILRDLLCTVLKSPQDWVLRQWPTSFDNASLYWLFLLPCDTSLVPHPFSWDHLSNSYFCLNSFFRFCFWEESGLRQHLQTLTSPEKRLKMTGISVWVKFKKISAQKKDTCCW